jgi:hypothetical protein
VPSPYADFVLGSPNQICMLPASEAGGHMKLGSSKLVAAFLGSGVPLGGDPITSFQTIPILGLRTATILDNCSPIVHDIVRVRFIATNYGEKPLQVIGSVAAVRERNHECSQHNATTLLPGESIELSFFRCWDSPGDHRVIMAYEARCAAQPFARLAYPTVTVHVRRSEANQATSLAAAIALLFHVAARRRSASEF